LDHVTSLARRRIARLRDDPSQGKKRRKITTMSVGSVRSHAMTVLVTRKSVTHAASEKSALATRFPNMAVTAAEATKVMIAMNTLGRRLERDTAMREAPIIDDILPKVPLLGSEQPSFSGIIVKSKVAKKAAAVAV